MTPGTDIEPRTPQQQLVEQIKSDRLQEQIVMALPENVPARRFTQAAITALVQSPDIVECDRESIFLALVQSAQAGLMPDGKEAALVKFGRKATFMPMIAGYRRIAAEHGWSLQTRVVYANDEYEFDAGSETVTHRKARLGTERGEPIGAYAIARHRDGRVMAEEMTLEDIAKVRSVSKASNSGPWKDWWNRMAEKSVGRLLFKRLPLGDDDRIVRVLEADDPVTQMYGPNGHTQIGTGDATLGPEHSGAGETNETDSSLRSSSSSPAPEPDPWDDEPLDEPTFQAPEPVDDLANEQATIQAASMLAAGSYVVTEGRKHPNKTIEEIWQTDPGYIRWMSGQSFEASTYAKAWLAGQEQS